VIVIGAILIVTIMLLLRRTRVGIIIRAGVEDSTMVEALGINVRAVFTLVFALGCAVAAFGGAIAAPFLGASIGLGNLFLLSAIAVVILGGLGSYEGTAIASLLVGLAVATVAKFTTEYLNQPVWQSITPMILLMLVLLIRPSGLFGKEN
jgi:branched-chain amino acid transport system permease protein